MRARGHDFKGAPPRMPVMRDKDACPNPTKQWYDSKASAKAALARTTLKRKYLRPYQCICGAWHLGHSQ